MDDAIRKADVLIEALGYIRTFRDRLTVIKLGGSAMEEPGALRATLQDVVFMETVGMRPILVHGGGKPIDRAMEAAGLKPRKVQGRRYTDDETLAIVVRVLLNDVNAGIVAQIRQLGGQGIQPRRPGDCRCRADRGARRGGDRLGNRRTRVRPATVARQQVGHRLTAPQFARLPVPHGDQRRPAHHVVVRRHAVVVGTRARHRQQVTGVNVGGQRYVAGDLVTGFAVPARDGDGLSRCHRMPVGKGHRVFGAV